jgi:DNA-binding HxlR family transcriptional regulator
MVQVRTPRCGTTPVARKKLPPDLVDVQAIMGSICGKWALGLLHQLSQGTKRNGELHRAIRGISQKMLTQTLRKLEWDGLVRRTVHPVVPPRVDYALTRLGESLTHPLSALYRWTEVHLKEIHRARRAAQDSTPRV